MAVRKAGRRHALARFLALLAACFITATVIPQPALATGLPVTPTDSAVAVGGTHACALKANGNVMCWGSDAWGQLGDGASGGFRSAPAHVTGLSRAVGLDAGDLISCAVLSGGGVQCWGRNDTGILGTGTGIESSSAPLSVSGLDDATAVTIGWEHACALRESDSVVCWGGNNSGRLGDGTESNRPLPVAVTGLTDVVDVSAGGSHTCAVLANGPVKCWGWNFRGQLGDGTTTKRSTPVTVTGLSSAVAISSGNQHTCAVLDNGQVWCWGYNYYGQLGSDIDDVTGSPTPLQVPGVANAVAIDALGDFNCATLSDGTARCWGKNETGQLGDGTFVSRHTSASPAGLTGVMAFSGYGNNSCALIGDGSLKCWGANAQGQVGVESDWHVLEPTPVQGFVRGPGGLGNDSFGFAQRITTTPSGDDVNAASTSLETGEPLPSCAVSGIEGSAWYRYSAAFPHVLTVETGAGTVLAIYTGTSLASVTEAGCAASAASASLSVSAATAYYLQASGGNGVNDLMFTLGGDDAPPVLGSLTSSSHQTGVWSRYGNIDIAWTGTTDSESGVDGYSYVWDSDPDTVPDTQMELSEIWDGFSWSRDNGAWYFHIRARDNVGNWSPAAHIGPFLIDKNKPWNPPDLVSTSHQLTVPSNNATVAIDWSPATDLGDSGILGYSYSWDHTQSGWPDATIDVGPETTQASVGPVADGGWYFFHVRAIDNAGNLGSVADLGPFVIDTTAPAAVIDSGPAAGSTISTNSATFSFSAQEDATFECKLDSAAFSACTSPRSTGPLANGAHTFSVRAVDTAGNVGPAASRSFTVAVDNALRRPDGMIRKSSESSFAGNNIYNSTGSQQTESATGGRGQTRTYVIQFQNDGSRRDTILVRGPGSSSAFQVKYLQGASGSTDITTQVVNGSYAFSNVPVGGSRTIRIVVTVRSTAPNGAIFNALLTARSQTNASAVDSVLATLRRT